MTSKPKKTSLADFSPVPPAAVMPAVPPASVSSAPPADPLPVPKKRTGGRGHAGENPKITIVLKGPQWERVHELARAERTSIQQLVIAGLSWILLQRGLPPLDDDLVVWPR